MANEEGIARRDWTPRPRIQSLSDLIFGLTLSIGAVSLLSSRPSNPTEFFGALELFGFSFLILALFWLRYTAVISVLPVSTRGIVTLNMALLFLVSVEPYISASSPSCPSPVWSTRGPSPLPTRSTWD